jgi:hypothetical protein
MHRSGPRYRLLFALLAVVACSSARAAIVRNDLSVAWISRSPKIDYVWNSSNPTRDGWPVEGQNITWTSHVRWLGSTPLHGVGYRWFVDGSFVSAGTLDFEPGSMVTAELPATWSFARRHITFQIDPLDQISETEERNNALNIDSDAVTIALYVERTYWDVFSANVVEVKIGASTFDDWAQKQVRRFNEMAVRAIYPETPNGVLDRWRIDEIHVVDDGALPLTSPFPEARDWGASPGSYATLYPNVADHSVDMQWGFPSNTVSFWEWTPWILMIGNSYVHEFAHARTMIDVYAWDISVSFDQVRLTVPPPHVNDWIWTTRQQGLMKFDWGHLDRYSAAAMNRMTGWRARLGNYNEPWDLGWFLNDLPAKNRLRLIRTDGSAISNASVNLYRPTGEQTDYVTRGAYSLTFDAAPYATLKSDPNGEIVLERNPFSDVPIIARVDQFNGVDILEIDDAGKRRWAYLDSLSFNLAYWSGQTEEATHVVMADAPLCFDLLGPAAVTPAPEELVTTHDVKFTLSADGLRPFDLFFSVDGAAPSSVPVKVVRAKASVTLSVPDGRIVWWFVERDPAVGCAGQHSSLYAFDHSTTSSKRVRPVRRH